MNIILHESPFIDSIYYIPVEMYVIEQDFNFRGTPTIQEHIILNQECALITFELNSEVFMTDGNVVCGKFTHPPKIKITFKNTSKKLTVIRLNPYGMFKLTDIPISTLVNSITSGSKISIDLSEDVHRDHSIKWVETMMDKEWESKPYKTTQEIIHYIDANFTDLPSNASEFIAKKFAISQSTLLRYFKKYIGINVSTYLVTLRRKKMIHSMGHGRYDLSSVQDNGYYDQSHFLNDFKRLYGMTLKDYFREMRLMRKRSPDMMQFLHDYNPRMQSLPII